MSIRTVDVTVGSDAEPSEVGMLYQIAKAVVALCCDMKFSCIIEGVDTQRELDTLRNLDCNLAQGYFYSNPLLVSEITGYVEAIGPSALFDTPVPLSRFPFETRLRRARGASKPAAHAAT